MWQDEVFYEDDESAMAAYEAAIKASKDDGDCHAKPMDTDNNSDDDDDDDDFEPVLPARRGKAKSQRKVSTTSRGKQRAVKPRKPSRVAGRQLLQPSNALVCSAHEEGVEGSGCSDIDIGGGEAQSRGSVEPSAIPTPDIGALHVYSSDAGNDSPSLEPTTLDTDATDTTTLLHVLRKREHEIRARMEQLEKDILELEKKCGVEGSSSLSLSLSNEDKTRGQVDLSEFKAPEWSVPIRANVMNFDWEGLARASQFDVILMDPPWQLASQAPTRGVAIAYQQLPDVCIESLPIHLLQTRGFVFIWVINNKYTRAFQLMRQWGYTYVDDITWVKQTVNRRMAKGHGYYLQHAKETCLVGKKGSDPAMLQKSVASDVIFSERRGQSQKPEEMYEIIEQLIPGGKYLEIFGRKNNLRDYWVTVGNEL
ncbi:hypothetical protein IWW50_004858 [Coemansia erecta]|nr:hypothetical protein IWW50_004858 [Coemansia erecta]